MVGEAAVEKQLYHAASTGDLAKLQQLLEKDPYLIHTDSFPCSRNLLHVAAMDGQEAIADEVLKKNPRLARNLDSQKSSPLHIAAAQGHVGVAQKLLSVAPEMCWCRDGQGLNPVHVAAIKGEVGILEAMIKVDRVGAMERVHRGQTVLHLCVRHGQVKALKYFVDILGDLVAAKDDDGETLLHWAYRCRKWEIIRYLEEINKIEKQSTNSMDKTARDIYLDQVDKTIDIPRFMSSIISSNFIKLISGWSNASLIESLSKKRDSTMVVMVLIATMAFQAAVSPPGGVWQDDTLSHRAGEAVIASTHPNIYKHLVRANTTAFVSSLVTIFMLVAQLPIQNSFLLLFSSCVVGVSLASIAVSFLGSALVIAPNTQTQSLTIIVNIVVAVCLSFLGLVILGRLPMKQWCLRWVQKRKQGNLGERVGSPIQRA